MRLTNKQIQRLVGLVISELETQKIITYKAKPQQVLDRAVEVVVQDYKREAALDEDVNKMMDQLERQNPGEFQRFKMFPLLKKRLAKEKGIIL